VATTGQPPALRAVLHSTSSQFLVNGGRSVDPKKYRGRDQGAHGALLNTGGIFACISEGATLVVNSVDDLFPTVGALCESAEIELHTRVNANLYAGWLPQNGFDLHWDTHDTLILQVAGAKQWEVYEPTRAFPVDNDVIEAPRPDGRPAWKGLLAAGSFLYMPRGWWHCAIPTDGESLHVTLGLNHPRGEHLVKWAMGRALADVALREPVPQLADCEAQRQYLSKLRHAVICHLSDSAFDMFVKYCEVHIPRRPRIGLRGAGDGELNLLPTARLQASRAWRLAEFATDDPSVILLGEERLPTKRDVASALLDGLPPEGATVESLESRVPPGAVAELYRTIIQLHKNGELIVENS
jgi:hypothetical protein